MRFEFATATRIIFGPGTAGGSGAGRPRDGLARFAGDRPRLRERGPTYLRHEPRMRALRRPGEPTVDLVREGVRTARRERCDLVIALGGGSAIDAGKAIAALAANAGDLLDYLEVVGKGQTLGRPPLPFIAVPTTAGTGAEVTRNAVLASPEHRVKASLRSPLMLAATGGGRPRADLRSAAADHRQHRTRRAHPADRAVRLLARQSHDRRPLPGGHAAGGAKSRARLRGRQRPARRGDMSLASLFGGMALANAGLGAVHGFAAPIGGAFDAPHGAVCAALLPSVMEMNIRALRARAPRSAALVRYEEIARVITRSASASAEAGAEAVGQLCEELQIPPLSAYGVGPEQVEALVEAAARASSMKANPIPLTTEELREFLAGSLRKSPPAH